MNYTLSTALRTLKNARELVEIDVLVDSELELAEIHRRVVRENGPAILFKNVKGSLFPVVTNIFGSENRISLLLGDCQKNLEKLISCLKEPSLRSLFRCRNALFPLLSGGKSHSLKNSFDTNAAPSLNQIPFLKCWPEDGGHFLTLPLVYTKSPLSGKENLGLYRVQRHDSSHAGLHFQIGKGGGFHFFEAEMLGQNLPVTIFLGGSPALILSAITPLPENISEILFASLLLGKRIPFTNSSKDSPPLIATCDIALIGEALCHERRTEGPFGDHLGYLDGAKPYPVFKCQKIYSKKNALIPATIVGKPIQEDFFIGSFIQKLVRPFLSLLCPTVLDLHSYPEAGFHAIASIRIRERYEKEAFSTACKILGEGQLSLTKILFVVDSPIPLDNFPKLLSHLLSRLRPEEDLVIFSATSNDTLDMTGPKQNRGSKAIFFGLGPERRKLPHNFSGPLPSLISHASPFTPGCLVLDGVPINSKLSLKNIVEHPSFSSWPLLILVDDAHLTTSSQLEFLWTVFTRFEPALDLYAKETVIRRNATSFSFPLLIDARMKLTYSSMLHTSPEISTLVEKRWHEYFPKEKTQ